MYQFRLTIAHSSESSAADIRSLSGARPLHTKSTISSGRCTRLRPRRRGKSIPSHGIWPERDRHRYLAIIAPALRSLRYFGQLSRGGRLVASRDCSATSPATSAAQSSGGTTGASPAGCSADTSARPRLPEACGAACYRPGRPGPVNADPATSASAWLPTQASCAFRHPACSVDGWPGACQNTGQIRTSALPLELALQSAT